MLYSLINTRPIIERYFYDNMVRHAFEFAKQQPFVFHMFQYMRQYDQVKRIIFKRQVIPVKYLHRQQVVDRSGEDMSYPAFRYFNRMIFGREALLRQKFQNAAIARPNFEYFIENMAFTHLNNMFGFIF